jgi:hypothetical protein
MHIRWTIIAKFADNPFLEHTIFGTLVRSALLSFFVEMACTDVTSFMTASSVLGPSEGAHVCDLENLAYGGNVVMLLDMWTERLRARCCRGIAMEEVIDQKDSI